MKSELAIRRILDENRHWKLCEYAGYAVTHTVLLYAVAKQRYTKSNL